MGIGHFLTQDYFDKNDGRKLSDMLIGSVPGVRTMTYGGRRALISTRGLISIEKMPRGDAVDRGMGAMARCYIQIIVDDLVRYGTGGRDESLFDIDQIDPSTIAAIEYYSVAQLPLQFNRGGNAPCGTLVIWSRFGPTKK